MSELLKKISKQREPKAEPSKAQRLKDLKRKISMDQANGDAIEPYATELYGLVTEAQELLALAGWDEVEATFKDRMKRLVPLATGAVDLEGKDLDRAIVDEFESSGNPDLGGWS